MRCASGYENYLVVLFRISREKYHVAFTNTRSIGYGETKYARVEIHHAFHIGDVEPDVGKRHLRQLIHADLRTQPG